MLENSKLIDADETLTAEEKEMLKTASAIIIHKEVDGKNYFKLVSCLNYVHGASFDEQIGREYGKL